MPADATNRTWAPNPARRLRLALEGSPGSLAAGFLGVFFAEAAADIDWVLALPDALETEYHQRVTEIGEAQNVKYVTSAERIGMHQGMQLGIEQGVEQGLEQGRQTARHLLCRQARRRFGLKIAAEAEPLLATITDLQQLEELGDLLLSSPDGPA